MARAAVIPQSPPKRATRGRAKGSTTTKATGKMVAKPAKTVSAADTGKRNARADLATTSEAMHSGTEEETDDELDMIDSRTKGKTSSSKAKSSTFPTTSRGRKGTATDRESEGENDEDELARLDVPKKKAGRPKTKREEMTKQETTASKPRGRPKGTTTKPASDADILRENTRRNARAQDTNDFSSSQQGPMEVFVTTNSMLRGLSKKKKVTFQDFSDSEEEDITEPAPAAGRRKRAAAAKDQDGLGAKPVRKAAPTSTRGRKPAAGKKGAKPLSPKKATQVAKAISSYASSDEEEDELSGAKDQIKLVVHSPEKPAPASTGLGSPVRRINFTPSKLSTKLDENGEPNIAPPKTFDFSESVFMSSPARRPPPSPFHFTLRETPKRGGIAVGEDARPLSQPNFTPTQTSPLRTSPRKANLGTPARGGLFCDSGAPSQPNFTPGQHSPLKSSPKKGIFGASFSSQQPVQQSSTPFRSSLLLSPAKKVAAPFKSSLTRIQSPTPDKPPAHAEDEGDGQTPEETEQLPLRVQDLDDDVSRNICDGESSPEKESQPQPMEEDWEEEFVSESGQASKISDGDMSQSEEERNEEEQLDEDDEISLPASNAPAHEDRNTDREIDEAMERLEQEIREEDADMFSDDIGSEWESDYQEHDTTPSKSRYFETPKEAHSADGLWSDTEREQDCGAVSPTQGELGLEETQQYTYDAHRQSFVIGLEDVFTEKSPSPEYGVQVEHIPEVEDVTRDIDSLDANGDNMADSPHRLDDEEDILMDAYYDLGDDEPTLVTEMAANRFMGPPPVQPYEIEEPENTPFVNFLLTHWVPSLPCADEYRSSRVSGAGILPSSNPDPLKPVLAIPNHLEPSPDPSIVSDQEAEPQKESKSSSYPSKGPRFTLLAEQLSQWKASSPQKDEPRRSRRRGVFSLAGRPSEAESAAGHARKSEISQDLFSLPAQSIPAEEKDHEEELEIHEDHDEQAPMEEQNPEAENIHRQPMSEIPGDVIPPVPEWHQDEATENGLPTTASPDDVTQPTLESSEEEKENEEVRLPAPATPIKARKLEPQTFHTVSKVPLKPEGQISPLKMRRKRGRSLSITSPVRSSPRLHKPIFPPQDQHALQISPRKSARLRSDSVRQGQAKARTEPAAPMVQRAPSPSKTPRQKVPAAELCLRGAVVYVDVHTTEGEDASGIFVELLQQMGARCIKNWSWNPHSSLSPVDGVDPKESKVGITHVVFKDGGVRTLEKVRYAAGLVKCVGVGWVLDCERENKWLDETPYAVDSSIIPRGGAKRRKSMEPRALSNVNGTLVKTSMAGSSAHSRRSGAVENFMRGTTPASHDDVVTPERTRKDQASHKEGDEKKYWQTPRTPAYGFNLDSIGMSPATPFYLSQRSKLVQQTCPPKETRQGLFSKVATDEEPSQKLKARLEAARRKSLAFKPAIGSRLID
ncbi:hypothetical protein P175DRAFT_0497224 [Aspergillus ochraceoroseus IBT 24754]|uniref:BRCT domain-containing protein n=2 Tax=Aspergillus ochraceoroseus TaxID=138278 RepID=A0A2T5M6E8_9EURO|nr:uncharacterized protein P175DRAFT_0497224 [Aspergillus ochraceoroseus IBT 24754]KKK23912.1 hypothetical protein AOCH_007010 [Aspergillus ochraceoroseus]PTU24108.1 hypothetical protein P175DRAFT_0497224 [Aspergillus ochraceoroseus IBT 24754]